MRIVVAVVLPLGLSFGQRVARGVAEYARLHHQWTLISLEATARLHDRLPVIHGAIVHADDPFPDSVARVRVGRSGGSGGTRISSDDRQIGTVGAHHLLDRGFRTLSFMEAPYAFSRDRRLGFEHTVAEAGATFLPCPLLYPTEVSAALTSFAAEIADWLVAVPRPLGIMASHDNAAGLVGRACQLAGIRVPDDVAILGVDNDEMRCELNDPPLSSVDQAFERIGYEAAAALAAILEGLPASRDVVLIPSPGVVVRRSTDVLAVEDADVATTLRYLRDHACEPITVDGVAEAVVVARRTLERRFKRSVGRTIQQEITRLRVERACELLARTDTKIEHVAQVSGFSTLVHFHATFKRLRRTTPAAYRRQFRLIEPQPGETPSRE